MLDIVRRTSFFAMTAAIALAAFFLIAPVSGALAQTSALQVTPDGGRTVVNKDVGVERWAISRDNQSGDVRGNVYFSDGSDPQFLSCTETSSTATDLMLRCESAYRCAAQPCAPSEWGGATEVAIPRAFFEPEDGAASAPSAGRALGVAPADPSGSGVQVTPDGGTALVNKDFGSERWAISRSAADGDVTGVAFDLDSGASSFVWCEQTNAANGDYALRCLGADSCRSGSCSPSQWSLISNVTVPQSFFAAPSDRVITAANAASLELLWDFPLTSGVTSSPTVTEESVYIASWDARVYAVDPETGATQWTFVPGVSGLGFQGTPIVVGDSLLIGDWLSNLYRLDRHTGEVIWQVALGDPAVDHIWSGVTYSEGRVFAGIASHTDNPCTNGRSTAVDYESGEILWVRQNVPERVCTTDTARVCEEDSDCRSGGTCVQGRGAGVTAQPAVNGLGTSVYVNAVGCYTFPSIGDSDSMMKLDAATGRTVWLNRVQPPEQFGFCADDRTVDCGTDADCETGVCETKRAYHDYGFLNGPLLLDTEDSRGRPTTLVVSGSKDGTLYAFDEDSGDIAWKNEVVPLPTPPGFAGFGLFNGAIAYEDGRIYAALFRHIPTTNPEPKHLMAFDLRDGSKIWEDEIGPAYAHVGVRNGILVTGTNDIPELYVYDANVGQRLATFDIPSPSTSRATVVGDTFYVGYGIGDAGGVRAYRVPR